MKEKNQLKKKVCAAVLAVSLVGQMLPAPAAFAAERANAQGRLEVAMHAELPSQGKTFKVTFMNAQGEEITATAKSAANGNSLICDKALAAGTYDMTITASGHLAYKQKVTITNGMITKLDLYNSHAVNEGLDAGKQHGIMAVGEINDDGVIDEKDADKMMDAIDAQSTDSSFDLNGDGAVNVGDLAYITANYGKNVQAKQVDVLSGEQVESKVETGKVEKGDIADLTAGKEDTVVQLAPKNEAPISEENPVVVGLEVDASPDNPVNGLLITPPAGTNNLITDATIDVEDTKGNIYKAVLTQAQTLSRDANLVTATQEKDGTIVVNLGTQIAIKKVTIKVTGASTNLVDIAQVEFVNGMENRIPEPEKSVPEITALTQLSAGNDPSFSVSWTPQVNITGYEVKVSGNGKEQVFSTKDTSLTVKEVGSAKLKSYVPYTVRVRSTNGDWKSSYSEAKTITIKPESVPPAPENLDVEGIVDGISVKWKDMRDTQTYSIYYRAKGETDFKVIPNVTGTSYTIRDLTPNTTYELYMIGHNERGDSPQSEHKEATPINATELRMPKYQLINTSNGHGQKTKHIEAVTLGDVKVEDPFAIVDDSLDSYVVRQDWDWGWHYNRDKAPIITLDQEYEMDTIRFSGESDYMDYSNVRVTVWDATGHEKEVLVHPGNTGSVRAKKDKNGNTYQELIFDAPEKVKKIRIGLAHGSSSRKRITISEVAFYHYDSLANDIEALFTDGTHIALRDDVDAAKVNELKARAVAVDEESGEIHPDSESLLLTLKEAEELLKGQMDRDIIAVNNRVTVNADGHLDMAFPLSDLQPLGVTVQKNEVLNVYVGAEGKKQGEATNLKLVFTQTFGEASHWQKEIPLKVGANAVSAEDVAKRTNEAGGAVYVRYHGDAGKEAYSVRVTGGTKIPVLDVSGKTGETRTQAIQAYVDKLDAYSQSLQAKHEEAGATDGSMHQEAYNAETCVFNVTDIVMNGMMYSVPADVVWKAINENGNPTETLTQAITAMEQEVELLYQHKGLHKSETSGTDCFPAQRLNVRYQEMFDGAFMYAGGKHMGVGYSIAGILSKMTPVETDSKGNAIDDINLSGWGVAHEIGHVINNKHYTVGEVTNNYYSILATGDMRSDYDNEVYKAVTSGGTNDLRTALAMYWQLHMAFDNDGNFKTYDTAEEMKKNLFFARMDSYARNTANAPKTNEALSLDSNSKSDNIIRLACAASEQNMLSFFEAWGFTYNNVTKKYAEQFTTKVKDIQYLKPEAHEYRLADGQGMASDTVAHATLNYSASGIDSNKVTLNLSNTGNANDMLGYEIRRNGEVVAFVPASESTYVDTISTGNNRVYTYEVTAYDKLLKKTDTVKLEPVKVKHDGTLGRDKWTATTNMISVDDKPVEDGCAKEDGTVEKVSAISRVIDGKDQTYTGNVKTGTPEITLKLGENSQVTALRYRGDATDLKISVSTDGTTWTQVRHVKADELKVNSQTITVNSDGSSTIFFENAKAEGNLYVCDAAYVKVEMPAVGANNNVSVQNIDLLGPVGDNVEWLSQGNSIGKLKSEYVYDLDKGSKIPAGSIVFTGVYKGNPAFNVVLLKDTEGNIVGGVDSSGATKAHQIILAPDPQGDKLGDVSEGSWIYWIEPDDIPEKLPNQVMVELYRVDAAEGLTGERLVSNTLYESVPESLPDIEFKTESTRVLSDVKAVQPKVELEDESSNQGIVKSVMAAVASAVRAFVAQPAQAAEASVQTKASNAPSFTMTDGDKNTTLALNVGNAVQSTVALQAAIKVDGDATKATLNWDAALKDALLKDYRFNAENDTLTVFITAKNDLLNNGAVNLGTLQMDSEHGTKSVTLTLEPSRTMVVDSTYAVNKLNGLAATSHELATNEAPDSGSGGSGSGGGVVTPERYDIAVESGVGGTVDVQPKRAKKGDTVTVTVAPKAGYAVDTVTVLDAKGKNVEVQAAGEQKYTFKMPASKVKVKATFKQDGSEQPAPNNPFTDIAPTDYFYESVLWATEQNLVAGVADNLFAPQMPCTRAQMVVFLWRTHGCPQVEADLPFVDVPEDAYYADAVRWAVAEGVTGGTTATTFSPDMTLTRGQTVVFLHREAGSPIVDATGFDDVSADAYYAEAVAWAVSEKVTSGTGDNLFSPNLACTRAQIVCFLHKAEMAKERAAQ
jgi:hypothetical protein